MRRASPGLRGVLLALGLLGGLGRPGLAAGEDPAPAALHLVSSATQSLLVELFTSEGCSSCPPADGWLARLQESPRLWRDVVPLALHVDYWDRLGWRDRFDRPEFTARQWTYARSWGRESVATPTIVVNGVEWPGWSRGEPLPPPNGGEVGVLDVMQEAADQFRIRFSPAFLKEREFLAHGALLGFDVASDVTAGENRGRQLRHSFVALAYAKASLEPAGRSREGRLTLRGPAGAAASRLALVVWVTPEQEAGPVQAVGGVLPSGS